MRRSSIQSKSRPGARALIPSLAALAVALAASSSLPRDAFPASSLSDAARETAKPAEQQRVLDAQPKQDADPSPTISVYVTDEGGGEDPESARSWERSLFKHWRVGGVVSGSSVVSAAFAPSRLVGLQLGIEPWRNTRLELLALGGGARFAAGTDLEALLLSPAEYAIGVEVRYALRREAPSFGPVVGLRVGQLSWRYRNGIFVDRGDGVVEEVSDDAITYQAGYAGIGMTFLRTRRFELGCTAVAGLRGYGDLSSQGLVNDLFRRSAFTELRLETRIAL